LLGICPDAQSYEGEAAMRLEAMANRAPEKGVGLPFDTSGEAIDPAPIWGETRKLLDAGAPAAQVAWHFHAGLADAFARKARRLVDAGEARAVALSGGCFQNALLHGLTVRALGDVPVLLHRTTPANDGGLALGQAVIAAAGALPAAESV
jgi:hydrogenase maturation protein HypF